MVLTLEQVSNKHLDIICYTHNGKGLYNINCHFWVETIDGIIIDDFVNEKEIIKLKKYSNVERDIKIFYEKCYDETTISVIEKLLEKQITQTGLSIDNIYKMFGLYWKSTRRMCMFNSIKNKYINSNCKIVFGSIYILGDNNEKIYIYGGENYQTIYDYQK